MLRIHAQDLRAGDGRAAEVDDLALELEAGVEVQHDLARLARVDPLEAGLPVEVHAQETRPEVELGPAVRAGAALAFGPTEPGAAPALPERNLRD